MSTQTAGAPADSNRKIHERPYVVLEEQTVAALIDHLFPEQFPELPDEVIAALELLTIYTQVATVVARNTEHASKLAGSQAVAQEFPVLIPVAQKMWAPRRVPVDRNPRVGRPEFVR